jgi:hypothetical protein
VTKRTWFTMSGQASYTPEEHAAAVSHLSTVSLALSPADTGGRFFSIVGSSESWLFFRCRHEIEASADGAVLRSTRLHP